MTPWPKTGCSDCDNAEIEIVPSAGNFLNKGATRVFYEVRRVCIKHGDYSYHREIKREKPKLKLV